MNAVVANETRAPASAPHPTHTFKLLLRREFWEHKGGLLWAPLIAGAVFLLFTIIGGGAGQYYIGKQSGGMVEMGGERMPLSQVDWRALMAEASPQDLEQMQVAVNGSLLVPAAWPLMVFGFVVFFYLLGALYDERKDRSVLFWKSLPVSDRSTVLSKVATALGVGPLLAMAAGLATMLGFALVLSVLLLANGAPLGLFWSQVNPLALVGTLLAALPMYVLWALPTVGWLLLCSAWARSKPFLWAILLPVFAGLLVSWFDLLRVFDLDSGWFWQHVVMRGLTSAFPGSHVLGLATNAQMAQLDSADGLEQLVSVVAAIDLLASPQLWIGAAAGVAMILGAIRLRRWRDEG